jgi:PTH1 family peptidyl-tRNA hydrolase
MGEIKMVVGLGNPGEEYAQTRHNIGFRVIDLLAEKLQISVKKRKFSSRTGEGEFSDKKLILIKPWLFMNRSGQSVAAAVNFYKPAVQSDLLVITDDMALSPGKIRIRAKGTAGGHKGLADIIEKLGTDEFCRLRIGIGQSGEDWAVDFVLDEPTEEEKSRIEQAIEKAEEAVIFWLEHNAEEAMNKFNSRGEQNNCE